MSFFKGVKGFEMVGMQLLLGQVVSSMGQGLSHAVVYLDYSMLVIACLIIACYLNYSMFVPVCTVTHNRKSAQKNLWFKKKDKCLALMKKG